LENLQDILYKVHIKQVVGTTSVAINDIQIDSRNVSKNSLFVAIKGEKTDGHKFFEEVINQVLLQLFVKSCHNKLIAT
jgi:UDP-N-acetylmuramoyl-L-alanyl-D-glutamate--2,6-diaminopimelate ligase